MSVMADWFIACAMFFCSERLLTRNAQPTGPPADKRRTSLASTNLGVSSPRRGQIDRCRFRTSVPDFCRGVGGILGEILLEHRRQLLRLAVVGGFVLPGVAWVQDIVRHTWARHRHSKSENRIRPRGR